MHKKYGVVRTWWYVTLPLCSRPYNMVRIRSGGKILGDMASVYFVSVAAVAAFYGSQALSKK